ncbi:hypothetical protein FRB90_003679 [Tulasnella sp. 427]|nr:hypothetical protein FRB90_003679 [Tulasnella sp. 427]
MNSSDSQLLVNMTKHLFYGISRGGAQDDIDREMLFERIRFRLPSVADSLTFIPSVPLEDDVPSVILYHDAHQDPTGPPPPDSTILKLLNQNLANIRWHHAANLTRKSDQEAVARALPAYLLEDSAQNPNSNDTAGGTPEGNPKHFSNSDLEDSEAINPEAVGSAAVRPVTPVEGVEVPSRWESFANMGSAYSSIINIARKTTSALSVNAETKIQNIAGRRLFIEGAKDDGALHVTTLRQLSDHIGDVRISQIEGNKLLEEAALLDQQRLKLVGDLRADLVPAKLWLQNRREAAAAVGSSYITDKAPSSVDAAPIASAALHLIDEPDSFGTPFTSIDLDPATR